MFLSYYWLITLLTLELISFNFLKCSIYRKVEIRQQWVLPILHIYYKSFFQLLNESWAIHFLICRFKYAVNGSMGFHLLYLLIFLTALQMWISQHSPEKQNYKREADRERDWNVRTASCRYGGWQVQDLQNKAGWALWETLASQLGPKGHPETEFPLLGGPHTAFS